MATGSFPLCGTERNHDHIQRQYRESRQAATKIRCIEKESRIRPGDQVPNESRFSDIIGSSPALQFALAEVERVAATDLTWRRCEPRAGEDCPRTTRSKSKQDCWERMASTGGSCFVITPWWKKARVKRWYATGTEIESRKREEERVRKENARLEERTRIAQELHDTLLQTFMGASLQLGAAMNRLPSDSPVKPELDRILQLMEQGIEEGRNAIQGLRSSDSRTLDLVLALSGVQQELAVQPDVDFRVIVAGRQLPLRPAVRQEIYRIGREALVNAFCHSGAKRVELELEYADSNLTMRVRDNGCGIDPQVLDSGREGHWGLAGMRERATGIGGLLKISSNATAGTQVQLSIPSGVAFQLSFTDHGFVNDFHSQPLTTAAV